MQLFSFGICLKVVWTHFPSHSSGKALIFWPGRRCGWHWDFWFSSHAARLTSSSPSVFDLLRRKANTRCRSRRHGFLSARRIWKVGGARFSCATLTIIITFFFFFQDTIWQICAVDLLRNDRPVLSVWRRINFSISKLTVSLSGRRLEDKWPLTDCIRGTPSTSLCPQMISHHVSDYLAIYLSRVLVRNNLHILL